MSGDAKLATHDRVIPGFSQPANASIERREILRLLITFAEVSEDALSNISRQWPQRLRELRRIGVHICRYRVQYKGSYRYVYGQPEFRQLMKTRLLNARPDNTPSLRHIM